MASPKHTAEQIKRFENDPYQQGKDDNEQGGAISDATAQSMTPEQWQSYVDGYMGRSETKKKDKQT